MKSKLLLLIVGNLTLAALPAAAVGVIVSSSNLAGCDNLSVPTNVDELGDPTGFGANPPFPAGEQISHSFVITIEATVCSDMPSDPFMVDPRVTITNLQTISFSQVWFVADQGGTFSNFDGLINGSEAMLIDMFGLNQPLVFESITTNGIFEPGESWVFHVQDYVPGSSGLPADSFYTPGMVGASDFDRFTSIVALPIVPEPSGLALTLLGGLACLRRRR